MTASGLSTIDDAIDLEDAVCGCEGLMVIEGCLRLLKRSHLKMMPMVHWALRCIETRERICGLALLIECAAEEASGKP